MKRNKNKHHPLSVLHEFVDGYSEDISPYIPRLHLSIQGAPGEYLFFHPGPHNARWRWRELAAFAHGIEYSLLAMRAHHGFIAGFRDLGGERQKAVATELSEATFQRDYLLDNAISRLYSIRERVAWLVYELLSPCIEKPWKYTKVSFYKIHSLVNAVRTVPATCSDYLSLDDITRLTAVIRGFDNADTARLFEVRNNLTHRLRLTPESSPDPIIHFKGAGQGWDIPQVGAHQYRYYDHLSFAVWTQFITQIGELSNAVDWSRSGLSIAVSKPDRRPDFQMVAHKNGFGVKGKRWDIIVRCMKQCRGYRSDVILKKPLNPTSDKTVLEKLGDEITELVIKSVHGLHESSQAHS